MPTKRTRRPVAMMSGTVLLRAARISSGVGRHGASTRSLRFMGPIVVGFKDQRVQGLSGSRIREFWVRGNRLATRRLDHTKCFTGRHNASRQIAKTDEDVGSFWGRFRGPGEGPQSSEMLADRAADFFPECPWF